MNADTFRRLALALPDAEEGAHQGHADFRVGGKIFATLGADETRGMVKVPPEVQERLLADHPEAFEPSTGAWGRQGCTQVDLAHVRRPVVADALREAWRKNAPKTLLKRHDP